MLKYSLVENALTLNPNGFVAVVTSPENKSLNDVIDYMIAEGTGLTRPQAMAYFEKLSQTIEFFLGQGHRVITPLFRIRPVIRGVFANPDDAFDSSRHQIYIRTTSGKRLSALATKIKLEKVDPTQLFPIVLSYTDGMNKTVNTSAVSDGLGVIRGRRLRFDPADNKLGVFLVSIDDPSLEFPATGYSEIRPSAIHFRVPAIPSGDYKVVVRTMPQTVTEVLQGVLKYKIRVE